MVPVIMLSGFLGSGKTTLLRNVLEEANNSGLNVGVLINEIGKKDVDGQILGSSGLNNLQTLVEGCVCCSKKSDLLKSFEEILRKRPDIIFVELTGLANAEEVMNELTRRELISRVFIEKIVTVIDSEFLINNWLTPYSHRIKMTYQKQITVADILVVNKMELIGKSEKDRMEQMLKKYNDEAKIIFTTYSKVSLSYMAPEKNSEYGPGNITKDKTKIVRDRDSEKNIELSYDYLSTVSIPIPVPVDKELMTNYLNNLRPKLIRAKGFLPISSEGETYLMQMVGNRITWEKIKSYDKNDHQLTLIGIELDAGQAFENFANLIGKSIEELLIM